MFDLHGVLRSPPSHEKVRLKAASARLEGTVCGSLPLLHSLLFAPCFHHISQRRDAKCLTLAVGNLMRTMLPRTGPEGYVPPMTSSLCVVLPKSTRIRGLGDWEDAWQLPEATVSSRQKEGTGKQGGGETARGRERGGLNGVDPPTQHHVKRIHFRAKMRSPWAWYEWEVGPGTILRRGVLPVLSPWGPVTTQVRYQHPHPHQHPHDACFQVGPMLPWQQAGFAPWQTLCVSVWLMAGAGADAGAGSRAGAGASLGPGAVTSASAGARPRPGSGVLKLPRTRVTLLGSMPPAPPPRSASIAHASLARPTHEGERRHLEPEIA